MASSIRIRLAALKAKLEPDNTFQIYRVGADGRVTCNGQAMPQGFVLPQDCINIVRSYGKP